MPVYQKKNLTQDILIGLWKISEPEDDLIKMTQAKGISTTKKPQSNNKTRLSQWLSTRLLLYDFFGNEPIYYDELGKPYLENGWFISISHSNEFVAIMLNKRNHCGIDIEKISSKVERIKHKYLNDVDLKNIISQEDLTTYWGAKEALYKYYGKKSVLFIENLFIHEFSHSTSSFRGQILMKNFQVELPMTYEKIEDYMLVYTH